MLHGQSVTDVFNAAGLTPNGVQRWGSPIPLTSPGVYVVALTDDADRADATIQAAPIGERRLAELFEACPHLLLDGSAPTRKQLRARIASFWLPSETVLYVGKASVSVRRRVSEYYRTPLGRRRPHAGGWFLKTLANLDDTWVHFAAATNPEKAEALALGAFISNVPEPVAARLPDPRLPLPFANLEFPRGRRKPHGISGATCRG